MKKLMMTTAVMLFASTAAFAQTATGTGTATANSGSSSSSQSGAYAGGGQSAAVVYLDQRAPDRSHQIIEQRGGTTATINSNERQSGTVTNKFAPAVAAPAMGSGHPCGLGNSLGVSIIGGGLTGGATRVDDACLLAQMGHDKAAMQMIAARNPSACRALVSSGEISPHSYCGDEQRVAFGRGPGVYNNPAVAPLRGQANGGQPLVVKPNAGNGAPPLPVGVSSRDVSVCMIKPGTTRTVITNAPTQQARMACAATLGVR